jgi:hypothetical protein
MKETRVNQENGEIEEKANPIFGLFDNGWNSTGVRINQDTGVIEQKNDNILGVFDGGWSPKK